MQTQTERKRKRFRNATFQDTKILRNPDNCGCNRNPSRMELSCTAIREREQFRFARIDAREEIRNRSDHYSHE